MDATNTGSMTTQRSDVPRLQRPIGTTCYFLGKLSQEMRDRIYDFVLTSQEHGDIVDISNCVHKQEVESNYHGKHAAITDMLEYTNENGQTTTTPLFPSPLAAVNKQIRAEMFEKFYLFYQSRAFGMELHMWHEKFKMGKDIRSLRKASKKLTNYVRSLPKGDRVVFRWHIHVSVTNHLRTLKMVKFMECFYWDPEPVFGVKDEVKFGWESHEKALGEVWQPYPVMDKERDIQQLESVVKLGKAMREEQEQQGVHKDDEDNREEWMMSARSGYETMIDHLLQLHEEGLTPEKSLNTVLEQMVNGVY